MLCKDIMHSPPTRLYVDNTVREAVDLLVECHMYNLPVVDRDEIFVGELSVRRLIGLMLPVSLRMDRGLKQTGFLRESVQDLRQRMHRVNDHLIEPYLTTDVATVYPDSPLIDALMLLYQQHVRIAVVERGTRRLVGGISFITILRAIEELD